MFKSEFFDRCNVSSPGICVIIDIEDFDNSDRPMQPLQKREGSHIDRGDYCLYWYEKLESHKSDP